MGPCLLRPSKASGKRRLGEPYHDGDVRKGVDRGTNEAPPVRGNRRVRPAGIRARSRAGFPVRETGSVGMFRTLAKAAKALVPGIGNAHKARAQTATR